MRNARKQIFKPEEKKKIFDVTFQRFGHAPFASSQFIEFIDSAHPEYTERFRSCTSTSNANMYYHNMLTSMRRYTNLGFDKSTRTYRFAEQKKFVRRKVDEPEPIFKPSTADFNEALRLIKQSQDLLDEARDIIEISAIQLEDDLAMLTKLREFFNIK